MITVQLQEGGPVTEMAESALIKRDGLLENEHELTTWVEYWLDARCVHRSVHVHLKQGLSLAHEQGSFS